MEYPTDRPIVGNYISPETQERIQFLDPDKDAELQANTILGIYRHIQLAKSDTANHHYTVPEEASLRKTLKEILLRGNRAQEIFFYTEHAVLWGGLRLCDENRKLLEAHQYIWRSDGQDGILLLKAFENWANNHGAHKIIICVFSSDREDTMGKVMGRGGYEKLYTNYVRSLV